MKRIPSMTLWAVSAFDSHETVYLTGGLRLGDVLTNLRRLVHHKYAGRGVRIVMTDLETET